MASPFVLELPDIDLVVYLGRTIGAERAQLVDPLPVGPFLRFEEGEVGFIVDGDHLGGDRVGAVGGLELDVGRIGSHLAGGKNVAVLKNGSQATATLGLVEFPRLGDVVGLDGGVDAKEPLCLCCREGRGREDHHDKQKGETEEKRTGRKHDQDAGWELPR